MKINYSDDEFINFEFMLIFDIIKTVLISGLEPGNQFFNKPKI